MYIPKLYKGWTTFNIEALHKLPQVRQFHSTKVSQPKDLTETIVRFVESRIRALIDCRPNFCPQYTL